MRRRVGTMAAVLSVVVAGGAAWAALSSSEGPVTHQSLGTSTDRMGIRRDWADVVTIPLNCLVSPTLSADASVQIKRRSGAVRVRVLAQPFGEGEDFEPIVFEPASIVVTPERGRPTTSSFTFAGTMPTGVEVAFVNLQARAVGKSKGLVNKTSLRVLWDARTPNCA